ncbi:sugar ABC transporter permease [Enterococcus hirae]|nr:sugar ABC transporter permease [Enterococcus hirae]EMF0384828.1 sugar ABC transporter permease [Enterococcus hirae]EMF0424760.1 sugar ABC transporter permease [Enterococcus hirae]EMF0436480.1 sugar ABC transporter permease [Enterococcus hirae]EMF0484563.1 sugar ABC transporter permease [Enterococcus hirae]
MIIPTFNIFQMSLFKWSGFSAVKQFVGLDNFNILLRDNNFIRAFQNTVLLLVIVTAITMAFALLLATIMSGHQLKGKSIYRFIIYIPNILSIVVIAAIFSAIYDQNHGLLNSILGLFHLDHWKQMWLGDQKIIIYSIAIAMVWQSVGYYMVMYAASMASIPTSLYESAALDGAPPFKQFFEITLPLIWQNVRNTLTFYIISSINLSFVLVKAMTGGGPDGSSEVLLSYMYKQAYTNSSYGYGMAIGVVIFLFSFILSLIVSKITDRDVLQY